MASSRRKSAAVALAVVGVAGLSLASAAQLGVTSASLGAGTDVVASCDTNGIAVDFVNSYVGGEYVTTGVVLSGIADTCSGNDVDLTLADGAGAALETAEDVVDGTSITVPVDAKAGEIENVAVVIYG